MLSSLATFSFLNSDAIRFEKIITHNISLSNRAIATRTFFSILTGQKFTGDRERKTFNIVNHSAFGSHKFSGFNFKSLQVFGSQISNWTLTVVPLKIKTFHPEDDFCLILSGFNRQNLSPRSDSLAMCFGKFRCSLPRSTKWNLPSVIDQREPTECDRPKALPRCLAPLIECRSTRPVH